MRRPAWGRVQVNASKHLNHFNPTVILLGGVHDIIPMYLAVMNIQEEIVAISGVGVLS